MRIPSRRMFSGFRNRNTQAIRNSRLSQMQRSYTNAINSFNRRQAQDATLRAFASQSSQLNASFNDAMQEYRANVLQFLSTAPPAIQQILGSEQMMANIMNSYAQQRPETRQLKEIAAQQKEYFDQTYGFEQERILNLNKTIQDLRSNPPRTPIQAVPQPQQDPIVDPMRPTFTPMDRPPVNIPVDPDISPTQENVVDPRFVRQDRPPVTLTPDPEVSPTTQDKDTGPLVFTKAAPDPRTYFPIVDPEIPFKPIEREPIKPIVDPKREPLITKPAVQEPTLNLPIVDPAKPAPQGLAAKPSTRKSRFRPSMFSNINTNTRGT